MNTAPLLLIGILGSWLCAGYDGGANAATERYDREGRERLGRGEVLVRVDPSGDGAGRRVRAAIVIDALPRRIWNIMTDCERSPSFVPGLETCRILESKENEEVIEHTVTYSRLLPRVTYVFRARYQRDRRIDFSRIGGDLRGFEGSWILEPAGDGSGTLVEYSVFMDPGFFVPQWMVRALLKRDLPGVLLALRSQVLEAR